MTAMPLLCYMSGGSISQHKLFVLFYLCLLHMWPGDASPFASSLQMYRIWYSNAITQRRSTHACENQNNRSKLNICLKCHEMDQSTWHRKHRIYGDLCSTESIGLDAAGSKLSAGLVTDVGTDLLRTSWIQASISSSSCEQHINQSINFISEMTI